MAKIAEEMARFFQSLGLAIANPAHLASLDDIGKGQIEGLAALVRATGKFDEDLYYRNNPDVKVAGLDPIWHFLKFGLAEKRPFPGTSATSANGKQVIYRQGGIRSLYESPLQVNWGITRMCNYKCSYCFGQESLDRKRFFAIENFITAVDNLKAMNRARYLLAFSGGEPTTQPGFHELLSYINDQLGSKIDWIIIVTNGSRQADLYERIAVLSKSMNIDLKISLHLESLDVTHIITLIEKLAPLLNINFNFMFLPSLRDKAVVLFSMLCKLREYYPFHVNIELLRKQPSYSEVIDEYTEEDFKWRLDSTKIFNEIAVAHPFNVPGLRRYGNRLFWDYLDEDGERIFELGNKDRTSYYREGRFNFQGMYCAMGTAVLNIFHNGVISGGVCKLAPKGMNIFTSGLNLNEDFISLIKCSFPSCGCEANDPTMKFLSRAEAENYVAFYKQRIYDKT